ncbi:MAG: hypothetical protein NT166_03670 [Candidatus Aminicenantes bacterium]|nr:hypothetical protein [Candidatus Aminicenantes bacterium]
MKKKYRILITSLMICLFLAWFIYNALRPWECCEYSEEFKKGNEIIQKIEDHRRCKGVLPESLDDIGEVMDERGPIFYQKYDTEYEIWFGTTLGSSCLYSSEKKKWTTYPVG